MFAPTTLFWELPKDSAQDYVRCGWSYEQWVQFCMETTLPETKKLWKWADSGKVQTQVHDDTTADKIFRFVCMSQEFCIKLRTFALSKGQTISLTGFELWESLTLARTAVEETRMWKTATKEKVMRRVCFVVGRWNRYCVSESVNNYVNRYMATYKPEEKESYTFSLPANMPTPDTIFQTDITNKQLEIVSIDEWNNIDWIPQRGDKLILSDVALFVSLHFKFGVVRRCPLIGFDNACPKDASVKLFETKEMDALFTETEFTKILKNNEDNNINNASIKQLFDNTKKYVC